MKGIILAAGKGTRLYPITKPICKPLLPLYDKPLLYYPLAVLMQAGIRESLVIVPPDDQFPFEKLLGDGHSLGLSLSYREQKVQRGIADAFLVGEEFIGSDSVCLVLGDNVFYSPTLSVQLEQVGRGPPPLRRGRVRPERQGDQHRGKAAEPQIKLHCAGALFL